MTYTAQCLTCKTTWTFSGVDGLTCDTCKLRSGATALREGGDVYVLIPARDVKFAQALHYVTLLLNQAPTERPTTPRRRTDLDIHDEIRPEPEQPQLPGIRDTRYDRRLGETPAERDQGYGDRGVRWKS